MRIETVDGTANARYILAGGDTEMTLHSAAVPTAGNIVATTPAAVSVTWGIRAFDQTPRLELEDAPEFVVTAAAAALSVGLWRPAERTAPLARGEGTVAVNVAAGQTVVVPIASERFSMDPSASGSKYYQHATPTSSFGRIRRLGPYANNLGIGSSTWLKFSPVESDDEAVVDADAGTTDAVITGFPNSFSVSSVDGVFENDTEATFNNQDSDNAHTMRYLYMTSSRVSGLVARFRLTADQEFEIPAGGSVTFGGGALRYGPIALAMY